MVCNLLNLFASICVTMFFYVEIYPQLESLIFVLKKFIYLSNLSAPYLGGISSYGLILMIVAYIQQEYKQADGEG